MSKYSTPIALCETGIGAASSKRKVCRLVIPSELSSDAESQFLSLTKSEQLLQDPKRYFNNNLKNDAVLLDTSVGFVELAIFNTYRSISLKHSSSETIIDFPEQIMPQCYCFTEKDSIVYAEVITENGILVSLRLPLSPDFDLATRAVSDWCFVSIPYDFNVRRPHYLQSIDEQNFVIFFKDSGIARCEKSHFADNLRISLFPDTSYVSSTFGKFGSFFKSTSPSNMESGVPSGLSDDTIVDSVVLGTLLVTVSLKKSVKVWNWISGSLCSQQSLQVDVQEIQNSLLSDGSPCKVIKALKISDTEAVLVTYVPLGSTHFQLWKLQLQNGELAEFGHKTQYFPKFPEAASVWFLQDFLIVNSIRETQIGDDVPIYNVVALFKSNTTSFYQILSICDDGSYYWLQSRLHSGGSSLSGSSNHSAFLRNNSESISEYYVRKLLLGENYSELVIETALHVFLGSANLSLPIDLPLNEKVMQVLAQTSAAGEEMKQWQVFENLCEKYNKIAHESSSLLYSDSTILVSQLANISKIRFYEDIELLNWNDNTQEVLPRFSVQKSDENTHIEQCGLRCENLLKFVNSIAQFRARMPRAVVTNIRTALSERFVGTPSQRSEKLFKSCLANSINEPALEQLQNDLNSNPDSFRAIGYLLQYSERMTQSTYVQDPYNLKEFLQFLQVTEELYFDLLLVTFVLNLPTNISDTILKQGFAIYEKVQLAQYCIQYGHGSTLIQVLQKMQTGESTKSLLKAVTDQKFYWVLLDAFCFEQHHEVVGNIFLTFDDSSVITKLYRGLVYLFLGKGSKSRQILSKVDFTELQNVSGVLKNLNCLAQFSKITKLSDYLHILSKIFLEKGEYTEALYLAREAMKATESGDPEKQSILATFFNTALELQNFDVAFEALAQVTLKQTRYKMIGNFVKTLAKSTDLKYLTVYSFSEADALVVDDILSKQAKAVDLSPKSSVHAVSKILNHSLKHYRILHAWRLSKGDVRDACEALLKYVSEVEMLEEVIVGFDNAKWQSLKRKQSKIVEEIYLIVSSLMKTLDKSERWVLKDKGETRVLLQEEDLKV